MRIIPAVDLKRGVVVHAVAGRRDRYRPLVSCLAADPKPSTVARGLIDHVELSEFYVADLDAIMGGEPDWPSYDALLSTGARLWIDAGIGDIDRARVLATFADRNSMVEGLVVGLESLANPQSLAALCQAIGPERLIFSLDLMAGVPRSIAPQWKGWSAIQIAAEGIAAGIRRWIVLDVTAVGMGQGCPTLALCRALRNDFPELELTSGGGIRDMDEVEQLAADGCDAVLLATALHCGQIGRKELRGWQD